ncbi:MAG: NfeD family protein [Methylobacterium sp.]|nr:NfeD family protein [Methylobacterium sp.]
MYEPVWTWSILGLVLLGAEMLTGTLYILWFGIAALLIGLLLWLNPETPLSLQLLLFSVLSLGSLAAWRVYFRDHTADLKIGQSRGDEIGRTGVLIEPITPERSGKIQFSQGLMGSREWIAIADESIAAGSHAEVVAVEGNSLRVKTHQPS